MTCTCSGHANEPNPCPVCLRSEKLAGSLDDEVRKELKHGDLDEALGKFVREECAGVFGVHPAVHELYDDFVQDEVDRRMEPMIPCPKEGP